MCSGICSHLALSPENFQDRPTVKEHYLYHLEAIAEGSFDATEEDLYDWALEPFIPLFREVEANLQTEQGIFTLQDYFNPSILRYKLHTVGGILLATPDHSNHASKRQLGTDLATSALTFPWPSFHPSEISICNSDPRDALTSFPRKVLVEGKTVCYFKTFLPGSQRSALRELNTYGRIDKLRREDVLRVPRLFGYVRGENSSTCLGLLLQYIDGGGRTLESSVRAETPMELRQRWADHVTDTVERLHEAGIVWGDVKAANVLIDANKDAWIIDFGGGFTEGWVGRERMETVEGDLEGLGRIGEYVFRES